MRWRFSEEGDSASVRRLRYGMPVVRVVRATVVSPLFFDRTGERMRGLRLEVLEPVSFSVVQHRIVLRLLRWDIDKQLGPAEFAGHTLSLTVGVTRQKAVRILCVAPNEWPVVTDVPDDLTWSEQLGREARAGGYTCLNIFARVGVRSRSTSRYIN
jgi:hypothetical protein